MPIKNDFWTTVFLMLLLCIAICFVLFGCQLSQDMELSQDTETVFAYVTDINSQDNIVTVQDTNGENWVLENTQCSYDSVFEITYCPDNWELLDYSVK